MDTDELDLKIAYREGYLAFINNEKKEPPYENIELNDAWIEGWEESANEN